MKPPDLKIGPWEIWASGERPPDQPQGGQLTGSSYRWVRWEGGPWIQSEMPTHRLLRMLTYLRPWLYDQLQRDDCPDCGGAWNRMEHADDCPRGRALRMMGAEELDRSSAAARLMGVSRLLREAARALREMGDSAGAAIAAREIEYLLLRTETEACPLDTAQPARHGAGKRRIET